MTAPTKSTRAPKATEDTSTEASPQQQAAQEKVIESGPSEVKYVGDAGVREITKADWKAAGVEGQDTVTWDSSNDYTVPSSQLNEKALDLLKRDRNLKIK